MYEKVYTPERMKELSSLMGDAVSAAKNTKYAENVEFFQKWFFEPFEKQITKLKNKVKVKAYCDKFKYPPVIDGQIRETVWKAYQRGRYISSEPVKVDKNTAKPIQTFSRTGWDDKNIYVYFNCYDNPDVIKNINMTPYAHDDTSMCKYDSVELFIAPGKLQNYYQFIVSPSGSFCDIKCRRDGGKPDISWKSKATVKTSVAKGVWRVEIAIPFDALGIKPEIGDEWGANFCRTRGNDGESIKRYSWSYTGHSFHKPELFGTLIFSGLQYEKK
jgi:hypothetical protein